MKFECIFVTFTPRTKTETSIASERFLCSEIGGISSQIYGPLSPYEASDALVLGVRSWQNRRQRPFFYIHSNTFSIMPRTKSICARANNSTPVATLFHETENLVSIHNGQVVTTSLQVAEVFNKNHKEVLRSIRGLDCSLELRERNFAPSCYIVKNGNVSKKNPMYYIGRDGFVFLVMGFTGKIAARFKEAYIRQFNEMEEMLRKSEETRYASRLLDAEVKRFNKEMQQYVRKKQMDGRKYFGGAGELRPGFFYYPDRLGDFKERLDTVFSQLRAAYADGFSCVEQMYLSRKKLDKVEVSVRDFFDSVYR